MYVVYDFHYGLLQDIKVSIIPLPCHLSIFYIVVCTQSVQSLSHVQLFGAPWTEEHQASLSITSFWNFLKLMSIESVMPFNHLILSSPSSLAFNLSQHQGLFQ